MLKFNIYCFCILQVKAEVCENGLKKQAAEEPIITDNSGVNLSDLPLTLNDLNQSTASPTKGKMPSIFMQPLILNQENLIEFQKALLEQIVPSEKELGTIPVKQQVRQISHGNRHHHN
jgi:hypothetical protein